MAKNSAKSNKIASEKANSAMGQLLAKHKNSVVALKKGESVKGVLTKLTRNEILVNLGAKTEAHILEKDKNILNTILSMFKVGDTVDVNVLNPESEYGHPVVSLRRFLGNKAWGKLEELQKSRAAIEVTISESTKAGFVVTTSFGISGFLPQSHTSLSDTQENVVGEKINASILEINRTDNKVIFSQKTKMTDEDFEKIVKKYKVGQKLEVTVANITPFGIFVSMDGPDGFIHISEVSWDKVDDLSGMYTQGQVIEAVIIRFDKDSKRINLSIRKLTEDPFEEMIKDFPVDKKVKATVSGIDDAGVTVILSEELEGFIKKDKIPPMTTYTKGQDIDVTITEHDKRRHRVILTPVLKEKPMGYR